MASAWLTRRVFGWALYDVASSTYIALVPTFFGLYFVANSSAPAAQASGIWGVVAAASLVIAGLLSPPIGAFADRSGRWLAVLAVSTACCAVAAMLLPAAARHGATVAAITFLVAQVSYTLATSQYDSLVVDIAPAGQRGRVSGFGWAVGLLGGVLAILIALAVMRGVPAEMQVQKLGAVFVLAGAMFAALAVPAFLGLNGLRRRLPGAARAPAGLADSLGAVARTLRDWRAHRAALLMLLAFFLINDVLVTIQFFIAIVLSTQFGLTVEGLLTLSLLFHGIAIPSAVGFGALADRWGGRRTVALMCSLLAGAILLMAFGTAAWTPILAVVLLGLVFGSIQAVFRSLYAGLVPYDRAAELFGFNSVAGRFSAAIGPLTFGSAAALLGSKTWALCLLLVPLAAGAALLLAMRLPEAGAAAGDHSIEAAGSAR